MIFFIFLERNVSIYLWLYNNMHKNKYSKLLKIFILWGFLKMHAIYHLMILQIKQTSVQQTEQNISNTKTVWEILKYNDCEIYINITNLIRPTGMFTYNLGQWQSKFFLRQCKIFLNCIATVQMTLFEYTYRPVQALNVNNSQSYI